SFSPPLAERDIEGLFGLPARNVHDACRDDQSRPAGFHPPLIWNSGTGPKGPVLIYRIFGQDSLEPPKMKARPLAASSATSRSGQSPRHPQWTGSEVPEDWHPAEGIALNRDASDREKRQMGCHQQLSGSGQLLQEPDPHTRRRFRIVLGSVVPVRLVKADCKHGVASEGQRLPAG